MPWLHGGYVGVDVFFVISGFLITGLLLRDAQRLSWHRQLADFYGRRARRILPAAATVIIGTLALAVALEAPFDQARATDAARGAALFYANFRQAGIGGYFGLNNAHEVFQQYWSLAVEEQFYALWPLLFLAVSAVVALRFRRRALFGVVAVITAASLALSVAWSYDDGWLTAKPIQAYFLLPPRLWELGVGVLLALAVPQLERIGPRARRMLLRVGLVAIAWAMLRLTRTTPFPGWIALVPTLGTAAVLAAGTGVRVESPLAHVLSHRVAQLLGRYSYSLYLWHWPIVLLIGPKVHGPWPWRFAVVFALSLGLAIVTYHVVENPLRSAAQLRSRPSRSLALGAASVAVCVLAAVLVNAHAIDALSGGTVPQDALRVGLTPTDFVPKGLTPELPRARRKIDGHRCGTHCEARRGGTRRLAFFGDSHLEHFGPGLDEAARLLRASSREDYKFGCPWFAVVPWAKRIDQCVRYRNEVFASYRANPPDVIVLSSRNDAIRKADAAAWEQGIRRSLALLPKHSRAVVLAETPASKQFIPRCLSEHVHDARRCEPSWPDDLNGQLRAIVESAGGTFVDLKPAFCVDSRCPAITGRTLMWADDDHVTAHFALSLGPWFAEVLRPLLATR